MITGFVVNEGAQKKILIRAVGPTLSRFGLATNVVLANPTLSLFNGAGQLVLQNDNWNTTEDLAGLTAATAAAGAFTFVGTATNDSALVATLSPGTYTAQVSGVNNTSGVGLIEVYDVTGSARLINLSTRALVSAGNGVLISGLVIAPGTGTRRLLIRAAGPSLAPLGVAGALADPAFSIYNDKSVIIAGGSNDNWDSGSTATTAAVSAAFAQAGAFPFTSGARDSALLIDLAPGSYTIQVAGVGGTGGVALVEVYDLTPETLSTVDVTATVATADARGSAPVVFTLTRVGNISSAINVAYTVGGSAQSGVDYVPVSGVASFAAGASTATVTLVPKSNISNLNNRTATLAIVPDRAYGVAVNDSASASFFYNSGSLFISNLRTPASVTGSTAYGTATIQLAPDEKSAYVNVAFSNLSSPEVVAHLQIDGNYVYNLPQGQVSYAYWDFAPTGTYSTADLIAALKAGRISVSIDTANFTTGELTGSFVKNSGTAAFNPPAAAPSANLAVVTAQDAARFLTQATFGPKNDEIYALTTKGYSAWINEQMALPPSLHFAEASADFAVNNGGGAGGNAATGVLNTRIGLIHRQHAWWKLAVNAPDQLRQRVAFALSQILVTSDQNSTIANWEDGHTNYYDLLVRSAFGNFRTLLEDVTLSPNMGIYLSSLRNAKATFNAQGVQLTQADENYAREIMQLFTIGLNELQPDGTLRLDVNGQPIATYTQDTIVQTAKVFTGWDFYQASNPTFRNGAAPGLSASYLNPMMLFPAFHDDTVKTIVTGKVLPASQGGAKDLKDTLDTLFNHPNTAPFISRQLIQRLVTSNPSPGYIYRVASVFANNGSGVRGDLGAVVRAILTDYEARSSALLNNPSHGKVKEPLLRATALLRAFNGAADGGRYTTSNGSSLTNPENIGTSSLAQAAGRAPTVFNFYEPDYILPGALAAAGLYAPEFQILSDTTALANPNFLYNIIYSTRSATNVGLTFTDILPLAKSPQQLVDYMNLVLSGGTMPKSMTDLIVAAITRMPASTSDLDKVRSALYLTVSSPEGSIQK